VCFVFKSSCFVVSRHKVTFFWIFVVVYLDKDEGCFRSVRRPWDNTRRVTVPCELAALGFVFNGWFDRNDLKTLRQRGILVQAGIDFK
jgi:hypothetical protein